jgi:hypothetical protein
MQVIGAVNFKERAMKRDYLMVGLVLAGAFAQSLSRAEEVDDKDPGPPPGPDYRMVQKVEYKEIEHRYCKMVPDKRRKWIYSTKPDYYCHPPCPLHWPWQHKEECGDGQACKGCRGPFTRPQLMKREIEWECGKICKIEVVKEKVPVLVWRWERISSRKGDGSKPADGDRERLPPPRPFRSGSEEEAEFPPLLVGPQER